MTIALETVNLIKRYGTITAIDNFNFSAQKKEVIALLGPNGAGKSTLMNMISGFLAPTSGKIYIEGMDITDHPIESREKIGFLSEGSPLYPDMSVKMLLNYMAKIRGVGKNDISRVISLANIENVLTQKIENLSKGYLRRVGFAQSILSDPDILLLDEPTDGLDPNQKAHMHDLIGKMSKEKTIFISTHLLDEAQSICNRIILINHGKIIADGSCLEIMQSAKTKTLKDAFHKLTHNDEQ